MLRNKKVTRLNFWLFMVITCLSLFFLNACKEEDPDIGNIEYVLKNESEVAVGFKVKLSGDANATITKDSVIIESMNEITIIKSKLAQEPATFIDKIEIWNSAFRNKYKDVDLNEYSAAENRYVIAFTLPSRSTSEITRFNNSVELFMDQTSIYGLYPKVDYPRTTYFFRTANSFKDIFKTQTPTGDQSANFNLVDIFGATLIACDASEYSDQNLFIKSTDGGYTWQTLLEFSTGRGNDDAFGTTDFIDETTGWIFNYNTVFNGEFEQTYETEIYRYTSGNLSKISNIPGFCVYECKFIDQNSGYILANTSNNTMPSDMQETIFMKTTDGGLTWSEPIFIWNNYPSEIFRLDNGKLIIFSSASPSNEPLQEYMVSEDDGMNWRTEGPATSDGIRSVYFLADGTGYLKTGISSHWTSQNIGDVYKTTNGGVTWSKTKENISGSKVWFYNNQTGYLQDLIHGKGQILYTTYDGGITWKEVLYPYDYLLE